MKSATTAAKSVLLAICFIFLNGALVSAQQTAPGDGERLSSSQTKAVVTEAEKKNFYELTKQVTVVLADGEMEKAKEYSEQLLSQAESLPDNWNYGNAVHVANLVLGHVALAAGDVGAAKRYLLAAGKTPGSPQLNSFGPNMRLAKALLEKGETDVVLEYFDLVDKFWKPEFSRTAEWKAVIEKNEIPDFRANLLYGFYEPKSK